MTPIETDDFPAWLPAAVLRTIRNDASGSDPSRAETYAVADVERVRRAITRGDAILAAHPHYGHDDATDVTLARSVLLVAGALIRLGGTDGG